MATPFIKFLFVMTALFFSINSNVAHALVPIVTTSDALLVNGNVTDVTGNYDLIFNPVDENQLITSSQNAIAAGAAIGQYITIYDSDGKTVSDYVGVVAGPNGGATIAWESKDFPPPFGSSGPMTLPSAFTTEINPNTYIESANSQFPFFTFNAEPYAYAVSLPNSWYASGTTSIEYLSDVPAPSSVPVPAAAWLFCSALAGFLGLNRQKTV